MYATLKPKMFSLDMSARWDPYYRARGRNSWPDFVCYFQALRFKIIQPNSQRNCLNIFLTYFLFKKRFLFIYLRDSPTRFSTSSFFHNSNLPGPMTNGLKVFRVVFVAEILTVFKGDNKNFNCCKFFEKLNLYLQICLAHESWD